MLLREEMNELRKHSMIAGSINSTLKVQGQRIGWEATGARLLCKELLTVRQSTVNPLTPLWGLVSALLPQV